MIKIGCCGFPVSRKRYFKEFPVVELQETFYQLPEIDKALRLKREAPHGFEFTMKAWQLITHDPTSPTYRRLRTEIPEERRSRYGSFKPTDEVFTAWKKTLKFARALGARVILFQCPPSFRPTEQNIKNMRSFFKEIKREDLLLAWEPRGEWRPGDIKDLCDELGLIHVVDPFKDNPVDGGVRYYRLHGIGGLRYKYTDRDLERLLKLCSAVTSQSSKDSLQYLLFNNIHMYEDAKRFRELITPHLATK